MLSNLKIMKILQSSIFRAVCAIAVGIMILYKTEATIQYITIAVGVLFFISGLISCLGYYNSLRTYKEKKVVDDKGKVHISSRPFIPIIGVGSIILGIILFLMPGTFVKWLLYILAIILILGAINLMMTLISVRKFCIMPSGYWVMPVLVLLAGVFILFKNEEAAKLPVIVMGIAMIVYGITEIVNSLAINKVRNEVFSNSNLPTEQSKKKIAGDDRRASDDEDEYVEYVEEKD